VGEVQPDGTTTTVDSTTHVISAIQLTVIGNATLAAGTITVSTASACTVGSSCTYQLISWSKNKPHIRCDANKLYNYMIKLTLIKRMAKHDVVTLIPDPRSIKVESGNSLPDYLQTELWFTEKAITKLISKPTDSAHSRGIQFADMVSGIVQVRYERNDPHAFQVLSPRLKVIPLFF
jgi:hypothetical protein